MKRQASRCSVTLAVSLVCVAGAAYMLTDATSEYMKYATLTRMTRSLVPLTCSRDTPTTPSSSDWCTPSPSEIK